MISYKIQVKGLVQGVGFRPFIYLLAKQLALKGSVYNDHEGVWIFIEFSQDTNLSVDVFIAKMRAEKPPTARIDEVLIFSNSIQNFSEFSIVESQGIAELPTASVLPDLKICEYCLAELNNPNDRRFQYPFINCTQCGPRFSIVQSLPYDRSRTTMSEFIMCGDCKNEYQDPTSRRFHAEPIACSNCGPALQLVALPNQASQELKLKLKLKLKSSVEVIKRAVKVLKNGKILAVKGIGGFQLMVRASDFAAVARLREKKQRPRKPFAIMVKDLEMAKIYTKVSIIEEATLVSQAAPIVLLPDLQLLASNINPDNPYLGLMLTTSPLHFLILAEVNEPLVVTSGNLSEEPLCIDNDEAFDRLKNIADFFLIHNRRIERPVDDSVVQIVEDHLGQHLMILRRARGYAPVMFKCPDTKNKNKILALGAQLKNTFAFQNTANLFLSQHIGDLDSLSTQTFCSKEIKAFQDFYQIKPQIVLHDLHPAYISTNMAVESFAQVNRIAIQHHEAHAWAGIYESNLKQSDVAVAIWDGAGYGSDGTVWGGEFFIHPGKNNLLERVGRVEQFSLLGSEKSHREPWRILLSLLFQGYKVEEVKKLVPILKIPISESDFSILYHMWLKKINSPLSSSMGRIFDCFSCLLGLGQNNQFEAEAAIKMQFAGEIVLIQDSKLRECSDLKYKIRPTWKNIDPEKIQGFKTSLKQELSFAQTLNSLVEKLKKTDGVLTAIEQQQMALEFHQGLADALIEWVEGIGYKKLLVGGGVFQNRLLLKLISQTCCNRNIEFYFPKQIPINDGGISIGQLIAFTECF